MYFKGHGRPPCVQANFETKNFIFFFFVFLSTFLGSCGNTLSLVCSFVLRLGLVATEGLALPLSQGARALGGGIEVSYTALLLMTLQSCTSIYKLKFVNRVNRLSLPGGL